MNQSDENSHVVTGLARGGARIGGGKAAGEVGRNRRALSIINGNIAAPVSRALGNKKGLPEKHVACNKNRPVPPANRPMTRRFAAELADKQQLCPLGTSKSISSNPKPSESEDCIIVDVEEYQAGNESKAPIPIMEEEDGEDEVLDDIDQMEEDQMEFIVSEEPIRRPVEYIRRDIDCNDRMNPLAVVEYIKDIYSYYKNVENSGGVPPNYMDQQLDINEKMRAILIDWLIEVHYKFELMDETLFLMVNLIDRFLALKPVERKKLQLVGVTALLLACKYEEVSVPIVQDLIVITDKAYTRNEVLDMERLMVNTLQFNMSVPTPYVFMRRFLKVVQSDRRLELLSFFLIELSLVEYEMLRFPPSVLAAAAIFTAQCTINRFKHWNATSEWHTTYSEHQLLECAKMMVAYHQRAGTGKLTGVHRKYSMLKFGNAARSEPALFLLETKP